MKTFVWVLVILFAVDIIGRIMHLTDESGERRVSRRIDALTAVGNIILLIWGAIVLAQS